MTSLGRYASVIDTVTDYRAKMTALAQTFPTLVGVPGVEPWEPDKLDEWLVTGGGVTAGSAMAGRFVLHVWNSDADTWKSGMFNLKDAMTRWDREHNQAMLDFLVNPFWP